MYTCMWCHGEMEYRAYFGSLSFCSKECEAKAEAEVQERDEEVEDE